MEENAMDEGAHLELPLLRLVAPAPALVDLDAPAADEATGWTARVRDAEEACLLLDVDRRVAAISPECCRLLKLDTEHAVGALLLDLLELVDFSVVGVPFEEPDLQMPPLQSLVSGRLSRGLIRVRDGHVLTTYDVVGVSLAGRQGALAFISPV